MRKVRCLYFLMSLFSLISLICIGFSSWTISGTGAEVMGTGGITASPVYDVDEYATCTSVKCFEFHSGGFIVDGVDARQGQIRVEYQIDFTKVTTSILKLAIYFRGVDVNGNSICFDSSLYDEKNTTQFYFPLTSYKLNNSNQNWSDTFEHSGNYYIIHISIPVPAEKGALNFTIDYVFDYFGKYNETVYPFLITLNNQGEVIYQDGSTEIPAGTANFYSHARIE